jgi:membrane protein involved in colicin uptake
MTEILTKVVVNCEDGTQTIVPLTAEEIAQREADALAFAEAEAIRQAEADAKAEARASLEAKLTALGISLDELATL